MTRARVTAAEVAIRLGGLPHEQKLAAAAELLARLGTEVGTAQVHEALFDALRPRTPAERDAGWMFLTALAASPAATCLQARWLAHENDAPAAAARWKELFARTSCHDPLILLHAARASAASGDWNAAARYLRDALARRPDYTFHARAQALVREVIGHAAAPARRTRIAVLGSTTTSLFVPVLRTLCFRDGIVADWYEGQYGAYRQEILDPNSGLSRFEPAIVFIVPNWRDLNLQAVSNPADAVIDQVSAELSTVWEQLGRAFRCHVVQHAFDLPPFESGGTLAARDPGGRRRVIRRLNLRMQEVAPSFVTVLDTEAVIASVGAAEWHDAGLWHRARQTPSTRALPALAEEQVAHVRAALGLTRKVLVCDLDNTLWGGIVGEDGVSGIHVGPGSPEGEAYADLQRYMKELRARGVLLAVCSRNNPDDARLPFREHPHMVLRLEDFAAFVANWDDKVTNLRRIASQLALGTDGFVFLDDNPFERAFIRREMPEVAVVEPGSMPQTSVRDLDGGRFFEALTISADDLQREERYRLEAERRSVRAQAGTLEQFLADLRMQASCVPVSARNVTRVTQLVGKTNQFNLTVRRHTQLEIQRIASTSGAWTGVFDLSDRFGPHGTIGVMLCVPDGAARWQIDTWLMSCRVLGRQVELFMFDRAIDAARASGITHLVGLYRPSAKNQQVADLYARLGFTPIGEDAGECRYELVVESAPAAWSSFIEQTAAAAVEAGAPTAAS
ncbi:MAG: HAD-IIIC family phosphatase [Vicinamibacterales bacterium]